MKVALRVVIIAALTFGAGCASSDWIDRTLVTVEVTGTWSGRITGTGGGGSRDVVFELVQNGSTVKGYMKTSISTGGMPGPIDGTLAGDVFRFRDARGNFEGELTVSGDEMDGRGSVNGILHRISLRRADSSSPPGSPPR